MLFYRPGSSTPCNSLALPTGLYWGAFDNAGRFYVSGSAYNPNTPLVGVAVGRCSATTIQPLSTANSLKGPQAIRISPAGKIALYDRAGGKPVIYTYNPPVNNALGSPIATTPLEHVGINFDFNGFAFTPDGTSFWFANYSFQMDGAVKYSYPAGGLPIQRIKISNGNDLAIGP